MINQVLNKPLLVFNEFVKKLGFNMTVIKLQVLSH